jgi:hypothetical protein
MDAIGAGAARYGKPSIPSRSSGTADREPASGGHRHRGRADRRRSRAHEPLDGPALALEPPPG